MDIKSIKLNKEQTVKYAKALAKGVIIGAAVYAVYYLVTTYGENESEDVPELNQE